MTILTHILRWLNAPILAEDSQQPQETYYYIL
jgi:hypothetical protein